MNSKGVTIRNLTKIYNEGLRNEFRAVDNISLAVEPGEFVTLLGPSGCGKTTTLRMIAGFEEPDAGEILLGDTRLNELPPNKRNSTMVFQSYALFPHYNIFDNVAFGLKLQKLPKGDIRKRVMEIIDLVGLSGMENRFPNQLSGGQQQRVALARALIMEPELLLFDEPLSNLDAKLRVYMRTEIRKIQQKVGITAIYVTHDQAEAMSLSDKIIVMKNGRIEQMGRPEEIYFSPSSEFVADFIGAASFLNGEIAASGGDEISVRIGEQTVLLPAAANAAVGSSCKVILRPEAVEIGDTGALRGTVLMSRFMGPYHDYVVRVGDNEVKIHQNNSRNKKRFAEGDTVCLNFAGDDVHILL